MRPGVARAHAGDGPAARSLLERAFELVSDSDSIHGRIAVDLAEELIEEGKLGRVDQLLAAAEQDPEVAADAVPVRFTWLVMAKPEDATAIIEAQLPEMLERMTLAGDQRGLAKAHMTAYTVLWLASRATRAAEEARLAAEHARRAGDEGLRSRALIVLGGALCLGPAPVSEIAAHTDAVDRQDPGPLLAAFQPIGKAWLARFDGRFDDAVAHAERGIELIGALQKSLAETMYQLVADIQLTAGNAETALTAIRRADAPLAAEGERANRSTVQAMLAEISQALGDHQGALAAAELSDELSADVDVINSAITHRVRAGLARSSGDFQNAEKWARSAVQYAFQTDFPSYQSAAKIELARVLRELERCAEASTEAREAVAISEAKGDKPQAALAQSVLDELGPAILP